MKFGCKQNYREKVVFKFRFHESKGMWDGCKECWASIPKKKHSHWTKEMKTNMLTN